MAQVFAPVAIGQFATGQGSGGSGAAGMLISTRAIGVTLTTLNYSLVKAMQVATLPIQITTHAMPRTFIGHMDVSRLAIVTVFNGVSWQFAGNQTLDPIHVVATFNDLHKLFATHMAVDAMGLATAFQPVTFKTRGAFQIAPMQLNTTFNDVQYKRAWTLDTLPIATTANKITFRGAVKFPIAPLPVTVRMNDVSGAFNGGAYHGNYILSIGAMPVVVTMDPVTLRAPNNAMTIDTLPVAVTMKDVYLNRGNELVVTDGFRIIGQLSAFAAYTFQERIATADLCGIATVLLLAQKVNISGALGAQARYALAMAEAVAVRDAMQAAALVSLTDQLALSSSLDAVTAVTLLDKLMLTSTLSPAAYFNLSLTDRVKVVDALKSYFGVELLEQISLVDTLNALWRFRADVSEGVLLTDELAEHVLVTINQLERIAISGDLLSQATYSEDLRDGFVIAAIRPKLDGSTTTWVVNTRSNGVTEYKNWNFNSFAKMGLLYLAANDQGVFQLAGDNDAGASIKSVIRSAMFQPGGPHLTALKCAYIGAMVTKDTRDVERVFLKLITDDDIERVYRAMPLNRRTSRVNFGKGLRSRYYAWELVTDDVDFDLDQIEFIPLPAKRRV